MRDSATPTRDAPLRRLAFLGLVFVAAIVSCSKDLTGPTARFVHGLSWNAIFPPPLRNVGTSSGVVDFNRVHVVLHHADSTLALDTVIAFPSGADSLTISLTVELLNNAPAGGEQMTLNLGYINAAGDTVFKGGPISITAAPRLLGSVNPPVQVPVAYTGPGANATIVVIAPRVLSVANGAGFTFTAIAKDAAGDTLAGTPIIWTSLDPTIATITAPAAGVGVALSVPGTARIVAQLLTGAADTTQLVVGGPGLRTWTGATSTAWTTASNWSPALVPANGDSVFVPATTNLPALSSATTIQSLTLAPSALLTLTSATLTLTGSLDASGAIGGTGTIALNSATAATVKGTTAVSMQVAGLYTVTGNLTANSLQLTNSGSLDINGQTVVISGAMSTASTATIVMTQAAGTLGVIGSASFGGGDETGKLTAGNLSVGGNFSEGGGNSGAFNAGSAHTLTLSATAATTLSLADPTTSHIGNLSIVNSAGVTALTTFTANNVTIATGALTGSAGATINGTLTDPLAHWAAGDITFATSTTPVSAATPSIAPASQVTFSNNPSILAGNLTLSGIVNVTGNLVVNGHTLTVNGNLATSGSGQLTMNNSSDIVNVTGNVAFGSTGAGGPMTAGTLNLAGNFTQSGGAQSFSSSGTNTIVLNGVLSQGVTFGSPDASYTAACATSCFQNFTVSKASGVTTFFSPVKVIGNFANSGGTPVVPNTSTTGSFIVAGSAAFGAASALHHVGVGATTFSKVAGTTIDSVTYFGTGQTYNPATLGESYSEIRGTSNWTSAGTLTGAMVLSGAGQLNVATSGASVTGSFTSSGTSTLKMTTSPTDTLKIGGAATFGGGPTTGLLTTGNLVISGPTISVTGLAIDASGSHTTTFNAASGTQTLGWTSPVTGKGYNNLTLRGAATRQFSSAQEVAGNMLIAATSGAVNGVGSFVLTFGGNITDSTAGRNALSASSVIMTGSPTVLPRTLTVNTLTFSGGTVTLADSLKGVASIVVDGATAHFKLNGHFVGLSSNFTTQNSGVLEMTNTLDTLTVNGGVSFLGGTETGLLTAGGLTINGNFSAGTGAMFAASGTHTTQFAGSNSQNIGWTTPVANVGFNNVLFSHSQPRQFTSDAFIGGTVQIFSNDTVSQVGGTAFISGAHRITLGAANVGILDQSIGGAWRVGATNYAMPGAKLTIFTGSFNLVDTTIFSGGGTFTLPPGAASKFVLTTNNVVVDNNSKLNLNGGLLNTQGKSFITQNGGTLHMSAFSNDSLNAGHVYFNGGATDTTLLGGGMAVTGLYQGFTPAFATVPTASPLAFAPGAGLHTYFVGATPDTVAFANPGTGAAGSHFYFLQNRLFIAGVPAPPVILRSDIFVDSLLLGDNNNATYNSDALGTTARTITTNGLTNSGTTSITFGAVTLQLNQSAVPSSFANNFVFNSFPANFTGFLYTQNRTSSGPGVGFTNYSTVTFGATGAFVRNLGSASFTMGSSNTPTNCNGVVLTTGQTCK